MILYIKIQACHHFAVTALTLQNIFLNFKKPNFLKIFNNFDSPRKPLFIEAV